MALTRCPLLLCSSSPIQRRCYCPNPSFVSVLASSLPISTTTTSLLCKRPAIHRKSSGPIFVIPYNSSSSSSSSMETPPQGYRRNVGLCLMNPSNKKIFAAARLDVPDSWQMPQGGIDKDEEPKNAAIRELREETGVSSALVMAETPYWLTYDFPPAVREKLKVQWGSDWKGQAQKWFLVKFTGKDDEINLLGDGTEKPEFGEWSWMSPNEIIELAVDFKKPVYKQVFEEFAPHLQ